MGDRVGTAPSSVDRGRLAWLAFGIVAFGGGTLLGWNAGLLAAIVTPPVLVRAALVGVSVVAGLALLVRAVRRIEATRGLQTPDLDARHLAVMIRGIRYVFLAVAAFSAGAGWLLGHPLPLIVALVIAGVDVLETTFLLVVVALRREG
jgi:hypothetical protein